MLPNRLIAALGFICATSCGSCDDAPGSFFVPTSFGTHVYSVDPDIDGPLLIDFGDVRDPPAAQQFHIQNRGRADLVIDGVELRGAPSFEVDVDALLESDALAPGESRPVAATFRPQGGRPARAELVVTSNDPDEPKFTVVLVANRTAPCVGGFSPDSPVWQVHPGEGPMCWPTVTPAHGHEAAYAHAEVPGWRDSGWIPDPDNHISFEQRSTLCDTECACRGGGDFTYFQTFLHVPAGALVQSYRVDIHDVDDGARITVYNAAYPTGATDPASYARIPGGSTADLAAYLVAGLNRIVITHVDDCCQISRIRGVVVSAAGAEVELCSASDR